MKEKIINNLKAVYDPEISINVYDLGLIYEININETLVNPYGTTEVSFSLQNGQSMIIIDHI